MSHLRVSVVTPSLNQARFLETTIRSVLEQDYPDVEYLVIDGGSTDGSRQIMARYAPRLAYWISEPDRGQADAINKGWQRANGEVLAYLNSDDVYRPGACARVSAFFLAHPEVDMLYSDCALIDELGHPVGSHARIPDFSLSWLLRNPLPQPTMFFRRRLLERIGWLDPELHYTFDWDFCLRAAVSGARIQHLAGEPLAAFRMWEGQKTARRFEAQIHEQMVIRDRLLQQDGATSAWVAQVRFAKAWALLWPAYQCYLRGDGRQARDLLRRGVGIDPRLALHVEFLRLYGQTLIGPSLGRAVRRLFAVSRGL